MFAAFPWTTGSGMSFDILLNVKKISFLSFSPINFRQGFVSPLANRIEKGSHVGSGELVNYYEFALLI